MSVIVGDPPEGFIEIPDSNGWHAATVFYWSEAFGEKGVWVQRHSLTVKPGEYWPDAFKRQFGLAPEPRERAFVPEALYKT